MFFDVDGTLVPGTSSAVFLADFLGHCQESAEAEDGYASGALDNRQVSELDAAGWADVSEERVLDWLDGLPLVSGISETVAWCWSNGLVPVLATLAWSPVGGHLADRFGFHSFSGPQLDRRRSARGARRPPPCSAVITSDIGFWACSTVKWILVVSPAAAAQCVPTGRSRRHISINAPMI
ncbi:haloacid dehalogenase-like hydrolase [Streptomyces xanthophaeus]|uniref:haloacid dehalogenase-like hydrolase n=1 Tax=Streptomyces xanthophaeus TaxID=67385 RepID=UPI00341C03AD